MDQVTEVTAFSNMIKHLSGVNESDFDEAVRQCLQAINDHGGKATMTVKFDFKRHKNFDDVIGVQASHPALKLPKPEQKETLMFTNAQNDLLVQRQEQGDLLLEESAPKQSPTLKEVKS